MSHSHLAADVRWAAYRAAQIGRRLLTTPFRELPSDLPRRGQNVRQLKAQWVPMHDGTGLSTDVYLPDSAGPFPAVLIRMPYGKREAYCYMPAHGKYWARLGYACVIQDVRGRWASGGEFVPFVNEAQDGWDTIDWCVAQPWCNGDVGMTGESYYGYTQWAVAAAGHPNLRCIAPGDTAADIYGSWVYVDGAFCHQTMGRWAYDINGPRDQNEFRFDPWHLPLCSAADAAGHPSRTYTDWIAHPRRGAYWDATNVCQEYGSITIPALHWGGWYDVFLTGTIGGWQGVRAQSSDPAARARQYLTIAATDHEMTPEFTGHVGRHVLKDHGYAHDRVAAFMDRWLNVGGARTAEPTVRYYTLVRNEWRSASDWPPPGVTTHKWFMHSDGHAASNAGGTLTTSPPAAEPPDEYRYDPDDPVTYWLDASLWEAAEYLRDRRPVEQRTDVLVYTSEPLERDLEVTGPLSATLFVTTSAPDTDFTAALVDVFPDGYAHLVQEGIRRLRYREGTTTESPVVPAQVYEITVDLWATSYVFARGHRLRVEVSSSNFDRYDRNPNTGEEFGTSARRQVVRQTVFHDVSRASHVTLSIVPE